MPPVQAPTRSRRRTWQLRLLLLGFGLLLSLATLEVAFHVAPGLLPASYRLRFPPNGVEFFRPGVLDQIPATELPLPYGVGAYDGPPPSDLVEYGLATPADAELDRTAVPRLVVPADVDGLPNRVRPAHPDIVLVGDSFTMYGAQEQPPGLQKGLERDLPTTILNLGIAGIGPDHELFLLRRVGLPAKPKLVVWFFYGGNDVVDAYWVRNQQSQGIHTLGELFAAHRVPRLILPSLLASFFEPAPAKSSPTPLPPFTLAAAPAARMWFYPNTLRVLCLPPPLLLQNPGWTGVTDCLKLARDETTKASARLLVVYLPSKPEVYLPYITPDAELLHRCAATSTLVALPMAEQPAQLLADLLAHRHTQEVALRQFCAEQGIDMWSAVPTLDALAKAGQFVYYATDTHWRAEAQLAVETPLVERLRQTGVFGK